MAYNLKKLESVILEECYHCHGTGLEPDYPEAGGQPPSGTETCHVCNGDKKLATKEIWSLN